MAATRTNLGRHRAQGSCLEILDGHPVAPFASGAGEGAADHKPTGSQEL